MRAIVDSSVGLCRLHGAIIVKHMENERGKKNYLDSDSFVALCFLPFGTSFFVWAFTGDASWLARSGSLITLGGLLRSGRAIMRNSIWDEVDIDFGRLTKEELDAREHRNRQEDFAAAQLGLYLVAVGTVIWGYGDLLGRLWHHLR
jgi:hypothetical protein